MVSAGFQILGTALGIIGWIGAIVVCALPMWKVTAFIGSNIVTSQTSWEGIWMNCVVQSTGQMQCKVYDSMLALSSDLQAARALTIISIVVGILAILLSVAGGQCTNCVEDPTSKAKVGIAAGVMFIIAGILCLVPVCWTAHTIIRDFYNPLMVSARLGTILTCALPMWRVTAFVGANIVTAQVIWEGLWMSCVVQSTGQMQCKVYDSMLALPQDLQAARAMVIIAVIVGVLGVLMAVVGGKCTNCMEDEGAKAKACIVSGVIFIIAAFLILIPVSWSAHAVIRDFYNPMVIAAQRRELGAALYLGWGAAGLLLLGGGMLCNNCPPKDERPYVQAKFAPARTVSSNRDYVDQRVVEVLDDGVSGQRHRHQAQSPTQEEEDTCGDGHSGFRRFVSDAGGAFTSDHREQHAKQREQDGDDDHGTCSLEVWGQSQQGVVDLALHLTRALHHTEIMPSAGLQILGTFLACIGFLGDIIICALPMWKVSAFIGNNIVTAQIFWEGLWMNCVKQSTGQMQCKVYDSMLALPRDLQAARALVVISILVVLMGVLLALAGGKCTNCIEDGAAKSRVAIAAGVFFIVGGILCLIPVSWSAHEVIRNFYNPIMNDAQRRELGAALFIGWGSAGLLIIGGAILCCQCQQQKDSRYSVKYSAPRSTASAGAYV
ncbi:uncharacterized protein LOC131458678 [Solea solea]|uniref:uncharacterized protein LOC131458678 n=1 Tax=Solea solea TaxID=90069 RepID=UPI0027299859|nr:uncharacterized protein LOC131458678 [Solea solea]